MKVRSTHDKSYRRQRSVGLNLDCTPPAKKRLKWASAGQQAPQNSLNCVAISADRQLCPQILPPMKTIQQPSTTQRLRSMCQQLQAQMKQLTDYNHSLARVNAALLRDLAAYHCEELTQRIYRQSRMDPKQDIELHPSTYAMAIPLANAPEEEVLIEGLFSNEDYLWLE